MCVCVCVRVRERERERERDCCPRSLAVNVPYILPVEIFESQHGNIFFGNERKCILFLIIIQKFLKQLFQ